MSTVESYKCPACGSPLPYDPSGKLKCPACGNSYDVEAVKRLAAFAENKTEFKWEGAASESALQNGERLENTVTYVCRSCGAAVETDATTAATHCPYCDNEIVLTDRIVGGLKPNGIIPFSIFKEGLYDAVKNHFKDKKLLPKNFADEHKLAKVQGVYVPFWLFDAGVDGTMALNANKVRYYSDSNYNYIETSYYLLEVDGAMRFQKVPVDGSTKADDDLMDSVEPYDYSKIVPFDPAYLSGFFADRYDVDPEQSRGRADARMMQSAVSEFTAAARGGYTSATLRSNMMRVVDSSVQYVLLPVYIINLEYDGKNYRFAVNGQTGKLVGELPICKKKKRKYFWLTALPIAAAVAAIVYLFLNGGAII